MIILKFNTDKADIWLSDLDFPLEIVNEDGKQYKIIKTNNGISCIKTCIRKKHFLHLEREETK